MQTQPTPLINQATARLVLLAMQDEPCLLFVANDTMPRQTSVLSLEAQELAKAQQIVTGIPTLAERVARAIARETECKPLSAAEPVAQPTDGIGIAYYAGKKAPHRAYFELNGKRTYVGYFTDERDAWLAADRAKSLKVIAVREQAARAERAARPRQEWLEEDQVAA